MTGLPDITQVGTLTADPELRFTSSGTAVANFTVASNERRYDREQGGYVDGKKLFLRCACWQQQAENLAESLSKGDRVIVHGTLEQRSYENREGERRTVVEMRVHEAGPALRFATARPSKVSRGGGAGAASGADPWGQPPPAPDGTEFADEPPF